MGDRQLGALSRQPIAASASSLASAWSLPRRYLTAQLVGRILSYTSSEEVAVRRTRAKGAISNVIAERVFQRADGKEARAIVGWDEPSVSSDRPRS